MKVMYFSSEFRPNKTVSRLLYKEQHKHFHVLCGCPLLTLSHQLHAVIETTPQSTCIQMHTVASIPILGGRSLPQVAK